ncbi:phage tail protein [Halalkalibacterium halodurans]|uniref:phage tail protein n=1 Tax=Halalkalibacterium halodurans TaxID=86665 RepID=UPI002E24DB99|nr:phage tail protein [Halalkalibacterium halodurans]MED4105503.1 phage tail protein [Halalkalibacterium halodurans]MED4109291.1 phage tail protein [Halalkalibacterium halodurans]MED4149695.1 phage tail protein [Halalkalibacterium halodurans]
MTDLTNGLPELGEIREGFRRSGRHTRDFNMWLVDRSAPTPDEKEILESVPFMQGEYDFSTILGERVYSNRTLSYVFEILDRDYTHRKTIQTAVENWLMKDGMAPLYDDHAEFYYYMAKCTSVDTEDSSGGLTVNIQFTAYPFKIGEFEEGNDYWDTFNFELDTTQPNQYQISGSQTITVYNTGSTGISPKIIASAPMTIVKNSVTYNIPSGESQSETFRLETGANPMTITGNGTIQFLWHKELI